VSAAGPSQSDLTDSCGQAGDAIKISLERGRRGLSVPALRGEQYLGLYARLETRWAKLSDRYWRTIQVSQLI
jgi:hypothetical protein